MELWQTDILAALEAGSEGLESAQSEIAKAYREAITHIGLTGAAESETRSQALTVLRAALEHSAHLNQVQPGIGMDVGDPVLDLLYMLTTWTGTLRGDPWFPRSNAAVFPGGLLRVAGWLLSRAATRHNFPSRRRSAFLLPAAGG